jgi:hypothetical protein
MRLMPTLLVTNLSTFRNLYEGQFDTREPLSKKKIPATISSEADPPRYPSKQPKQDLSITYPMRLAIACFLALSVPCWAASPTSQYIFGSQAGQAVPTSGQSWTGLMPRNDADVWQTSAATGDSYALMPTTGTFSSLCVNLTTAPGTGASWTWTLYKNGLDEYVSVKISGSQKQACDLVDTAGFVPGDLVALHVTPSSSPAPASTFASWYIVQTPVVPGETILFGSQQAGAAQYLSLAGNSSSLNRRSPAMETDHTGRGNDNEIHAEYVGTGSSVKAVLDHNESAYCSIRVLDDIGSISSSRRESKRIRRRRARCQRDRHHGNLGCLRQRSLCAQCCRTICDTHLAQRGNRRRSAVLSSGDREETAASRPSKAQAQQIGGNVQIQGVYLRSTTAAPGSGAQYAFTLRDNGANTALTQR